MGKADALNFLSDRLIEQNVNIVTSSFPIYATPIGNTIRVLLKEGGSQFDLTAREELEVKMSLFALNRLEFLEAFLSEGIDEDTLILFDRSAFSNALTIAYAMKEIPNLDRDEVGALVNVALGLDSLLVETLGLKRCVVQLVSENQNWKSARKEEVDLHENSKVQEYANYVYSIYQDIVGNGWRRVTTRNKDEEWRNREDIYVEIYGFLTEKYGVLGGSRGVGKRIDIGIKEIIGSVYAGSTVDEDLLNEYILSVRDNDKDLMYLTSREIKEGICSSCRVIAFKNQAIKEAISCILNRYPKILDVLGYNLGRKFVLDLKEATRDE